MTFVRHIATYTSLYLCCGLVALLGLSAQPAAAATRYISDELTVPVRSGPSNRHRIVHAGLPSGTRMEVLEEDEQAGFSRIQTSNGTEGWIRTQYLVAEPIAKLKLSAAQESLRRARAELAAEQAKVQELTQTARQQSSANTSSQQQIERLQSELAEIKRISADAITTHDTNLKLTENNARLQEELDDLAESHARLQDNTENQMLMIGGGLILLGLLAGAAIKARPQRSAWS
jgi:SH3 domain protein